MQFTPQQMAGAQRYCSKTRIGNWYEDERLAEARFSAFTAKKNQNLLGSDLRRKKMSTCLQKVPLSFSSDNILRYGAVVQLDSVEVGGMLACDPFEEISLSSQSYLATVCPRTALDGAAASEQTSVVPARTAFRVVKVTDPRLKDTVTQMQLYRDRQTSLPDGDGEPVRLGEEFHLVCDPGLRVCDAGNMRKPDLFLVSAPKSQSLASRVSNNQAVFLRASASSGSVWFFQKTTHGKDGSLNRILAKGSPVLVDTEIVLQHRDTMMALSCERENIEPTNFGTEFEVCCGNKTTRGKTLQLVAEQKGSKTAAAAAKAELRSNRWIVRQGTERKEGERSYQDRKIPPEMTAGNVLQEIRRAIKARATGSGIHGLRAALRAVHPGHNGKMDREDVRWGLYDYGLLPSDDEQSQVLLDNYDYDGSGLIRIEEFLSDLREPLSEGRKNILQDAFLKLRPNENGQVSVRHVEGVFNAEAAARGIMNNSCNNNNNNDNNDKASDAGNTNHASVPTETVNALLLGWRLAESTTTARGGSRNNGSSGNDGIVTLGGFERYHQDLLVGTSNSDSDDNDCDCFQAIVASEWNTTLLQ